MSAHRSEAPTPKTPREEAADWMALKRSAEMSVNDEREFQVWLSISANREAWRDLEQTWDFLGDLRDDPELMSLRELRRRQSHQLANARAAGVLAACALGAVTAGWFAHERGWLPLPYEAQPVQVQEYRTSVGQRSTVKLPDGSIVTLDTDSALRTQTFGAVRRVELARGRAFFQVAKDAKHPFIVSADGKTVTAVGTAFDVMIDGAGLEVTLAEGKVRVEEPREGLRQGQMVELPAGARLTMPIGGQWRAKMVDIDKETSWLTGRLVFDDDTLAEAAEEMNRYSEKKIVIRDRAIAERSIVGMFRAGDVEGFARAAQLYGLARIGADEEDYIELKSF